MAPWLDQVFHRLRRWQVEHGEPHLCKTHAFGITRSEPLMRWRFYSVDSAGVVKSSACGCVIDSNYDGSITVRSVSPDRRSGSMRHASKHPSLTDAGKDSPRYQERRVYSAATLNRLERHATKVWKARGVSWPEPELGAVNDIAT
jgi:hypothetical protein